MRIVHLYKDYYPPVLGGIESTVSRLAHGAVERGAEVTVLTSAHGERKSREDVDAGVKVIRCAEWARVASTPICPGMPARLARLKADILHLHFPSPPGEVSALLAAPPSIWVMTYHSDVVRQAAVLPLYQPVIDRVLRRCATIMPTSPQYIDHSKNLRRHRSRCHVVPLGIELERFTPTPDLEASAARIRERIGPPWILFVGRFRYYKGLDVLLRAMSRVRGRLVLVGRGPEETRLRALVDELGLRDRIHFAGEVGEAELPAWYRAADVCVLPSILPSEALGITLIEALASGRPVVSTELGTGTSFVNLEGETGLIVPPGNPEALALALDRLLHDPELRDRMGEAGRRRAWSLFSKEHMVQAVLEQYEAAIAGGGLTYPGM